MALASIGSPTGVPVPAFRRSRDLLSANLWLFIFLVFLFFFLFHISTSSPRPANGELTVGLDISRLGKGQIRLLIDVLNQILLGLLAGLCDDGSVSILIRA